MSVTGAVQIARPSARARATASVAASPGIGAPTASGRRKLAGSPQASALPGPKRLFRRSSTSAPVRACAASPIASRSVRMPSVWRSESRALRSCASAVIRIGPRLRAAKRVRPRGLPGTHHEVAEPQRRDVLGACSGSTAPGRCRAGGSPLRARARRGLRPRRRPARSGGSPPRAAPRAQAACPGRRAAATGGRAAARRSARTPRRSARPRPASITSGLTAPVSR